MFADASAAHADAADHDAAPHPEAQVQAQSLAYPSSVGRQMRLGPRPQPWMLCRIMRVLPWRVCLGDGGRCASAGSIAAITTGAVS